MSSTEGEIITSEPEERSLEERFQSKDVLYISFHKCWFNMVPCCELREMEFFPCIKMRNPSDTSRIRLSFFLWAMG